MSVGFNGIGERIYTVLVILYVYVLMVVELFVDNFMIKDCTRSGTRFTTSG